MAKTIELLERDLALAERISAAMVRHRELLELGATAGEIAGRFDVGIYNALPDEAKEYAEYHAQMYLEANWEADLAFFQGLILGIAVMRIMDNQK